MLACMLSALCVPSLLSGAAFAQPAGAGVATPNPQFAAPAAVQPRTAAAGQSSETARLIEGIGGIEWGWGPRETQATIRNKAGVQPTVLWIGRIVDVRIGRSVTGGEDGVLEFLAAYQPLIKPSPAALVPPIRLRPETGDHFVVSLRSPPVTEDMVKNLRQSMLDRTHYAVVLGEPKFIAPYGRQVAIFLQTQRASLSQSLKVEVVRE